MSESEIIWRGKRYWTQTPLSFEHLGWNTGFVPYYVIKETAYQITARAANGDTVRFARKDWESKNKIYHTKHHEYFYRVKPEIDPEAPTGRYDGKFHNANDFAQYLRDNSGVSALSVLGLPHSATKADMKRAYKQLARKAHPDGGGSHEEFLALKKNYEQALMQAQP